MTRTARYDASINALVELPDLDPPPDKPIENNYWGRVDLFYRDMNNWKIAQDHYNANALKVAAGCRTIPCAPECKDVFVDKQEYEEWKDFTIKYQFFYGIDPETGGDIWTQPLEQPFYRSMGVPERLVAFPISVKSEDELWREMILKHFNDSEHDYSDAFIDVKVAELKKHFTITRKHKTMPRKTEYNPVSCDHKAENGLSAWMFQSESQGNFPGTGFKVSYFVCSECGEISIGGRREDRHGKINYFDETIHIHHPDAIEAIIKQANFYNEDVAWQRVPPTPASLEQEAAALYPYQVDDDNIAYTIEELAEVNAIRSALRAAHISCASRYRDEVDKLRAENERMKTLVKELWDSNVAEPCRRQGVSDAVLEDHWQQYKIKNSL